VSAETAYGRCDLGLIMEASDRWGRLVIKRAYGDWTRFREYAQVLIEHSIELIQLFHYGLGQRKNAADIQMAVDALETALTHPDIDTFVLATGDSDFSAVARKLREHGKRVIGIGLRQATSEVLVKACDTFILYDNLIEPDTRTINYELKRSRQLLMDAMHKLEEAHPRGEVLATRLKQTMLQEDPTFSEVSLGYQQFKDFLEAQYDLVDTSWRGPQETELVVIRKSTADESLLQDETLSYRQALNSAGLHLLAPSIRTDVLRNLYELLAEHPDEFTFDQAVLQLKARYDARNVLRSREEVQEVAKLLKYADVLEPHPESWELDRLQLKPGLDVQSFRDRCESVYVAIFRRQNLPVEPERLSLLLFGLTNQRPRVERLLHLAETALPGQVRSLRQTSQWECPAWMEQSSELEIVLEDLNACKLKEAPSLERASELNNQGLHTRTFDFEDAQKYFLQAAKMMYRLLCEGRPGANLMDLEWYLASYSASAAGAHFSRYDYPAAEKYYQAFFALVLETEPVWEKVRNLVQPMLSYYFTIAANENHEMLDVSPGRTHPARIAIALQQHSNRKVRQRWADLVTNLVRVNPPLLRLVDQMLETLESSETDPAARETHQVLQRLMHAADREEES
ncbi:MAG: NYN domain-containing protein, partial [Anaerolineae bacterium]